MAERKIKMISGTVNFDVQEVLTDLKKDCKSSAEKRLLSMINDAFAQVAWHDESEWDKYIGNENEDVLIEYRNGSTSHERSNWIIKDANGRLFTQYGKERVVFFAKFPKPIDPPKAQSEDEDVFVAPDLTAAEKEE